MNIPFKLFRHLFRYKYLLWTTHFLARNNLARIVVFSRTAWHIVAWLGAVAIQWFLTLVYYADDRRRAILDAYFRALLQEHREAAIHREGTYPAMRGLSRIHVSQKTARWYLEWFRSIDTSGKRRITKRFANIALLSLKRSVDNLRYEDQEDWLPNLRYMILAQFDRCNLNCVGCYTNSDRDKGQITFHQLDYIMGQAASLNMVLTSVVGKGEPFYNQTSTEMLLRLVRGHPRMTFLVFTNGTTLKREDIQTITKAENLIPVVSIDGLEETNDARRGRGVYRKIKRTCHMLSEHSIPFGYAVTVYRQNWRDVSSPGFVKEMMSFGAKFGIYFRFVYVPLDENTTPEMILRQDDIVAYLQLLEQTQSSVPIPLIDSDIAEQSIGGCFSRKGNLIYVDAITGKVAPCVKTPFSPETSNLYLKPHSARLREILNSPFFNGYRAKFPDYYQCGIDYKRELDAFLNVEELSVRDRTQVIAMKSPLEGTAD